MRQTKNLSGTKSLRLNIDNILLYLAAIKWLKVLFPFIDGHLLTTNYFDAECKLIVLKLKAACFISF